METDAPLMCKLLVGLPDVTVLPVDDQAGQPIRVHVEQRVYARTSLPAETRSAALFEYELRRSSALMTLS